MASAILFPLALKSGGFPLEASDYSAIFGLPWTSLHFKLLFGLGIRGFQSKNGSQKKLSFSSCRLVFLLFPLLIVLLFVDRRLTTLHVIPFIKQASQVAASLRLVVGQTILQPRVSRRQLLIHGSKCESLYSEICSHTLIISAIF
nr:uncharacterized protein LOC114824307 [Malus domestica]